MIISIINQKGGVGKTTTAVSLAGRFSKMEKMTLLVDLDPQANATVAFGLKENIEPFQIVNQGKYLDIMPASKKLSFLEPTLPQDYVQNILKDRNDEFIIIDCPPVLNNLSVNAIYAAEFLIIPVLSADFYSLVGLKDIFRAITSVNPEGDYRVLLTNLNERLAITAHFIEKIIEAIQRDKIFTTGIRIDSKLREAPFAGIPINIYDVNSKGSLNYGDLSLEIIKLTGEKHGKTQI